jgi:transcriptional regulator with XRE-family HTH domain
MSNKLCTNLKLARLFIGWSQERAEYESGVSRVQISHIETGEADPRISTVMKLAEAYGLEIKLCDTKQS